MTVYSNICASIPVFALVIHDMRMQKTKCYERLRDACHMLVQVLIIRWSCDITSGLLCEAPVVGYTTRVLSSSAQK
jgi:hypothetical protein